MESRLNGVRLDRIEKKKETKAIEKKITEDWGVSMKIRGKFKKRKMKKEGKTKEINEEKW